MEQDMGTSQARKFDDQQLVALIIKMPAINTDISIFLRNYDYNFL